MRIVKRVRIQSRGKKTKAWEKERRKLKIQFERNGITSCELRYEGCWGDRALGFLHLRKRRHLKPEELSIVVLGCNPCHDKVEILPECQMYEILSGVIESRELAREAA